MRNRPPQLLQEVTTRQPQDFEAWIDLAVLMERRPTATKEIVEAYMKAEEIMVENDIEVAPVLMNNIGSALFKMGDYHKALARFTDALAVCKKKTTLLGPTAATNHKYYQGLVVSIKYNIALTSERTDDTVTATAIYTELSDTHKSYTDAQMRLGIMKLDKKLSPEVLDLLSPPSPIMPP